MPDLHEVGVELFILLSVLSLILVVSKPVAKEFEATALVWIQALKKIQAERRKTCFEPPVEQSRLEDHTDSNDELP